MPKVLDGQRFERRAVPAVQQVQHDVVFASGLGELLATDVEVETLGRYSR